MSLHDTTDPVIDTTDPSPWLPAASTVVGRKHTLINSGPLPVSWTVAGNGKFNTSASLTPVLVASLVIPAGFAWNVQSEGQWWRSAKPIRRTDFLTGLTDASGLAVLSFAAPFAEPPVVLVSPVAPVAGVPLTAEVVGATAAGVSVRVWEGGTAAPAGVRVNIAATA